jgi:hypothetical protein
MIPGSSRNWIAVNAVQQSILKQKLKTKNMATSQLRKSRIRGGGPAPQVVNNQ